MPASSSDPLAVAASTSSSGFVDGLGRRSLAFDREEGTMLERLTLRPELAAFGASLRDRVERVSAVEDERIARPLTIEQDADGSLAVVSEFVPGSRLSDLLDSAADQAASPGVDAAFGYLLDVLPALCGLHAGAGFFHGAISPSRTVLTPAGQVVLLDAIYGDALSHLRYSRRKLWTEFGIVTSDTASSPRLNVQSDIAQVVLSAVMLVLGRPLYVDEYPDALARLLLEVGEVAQIRGSGEFATGFQVFLHRSLPLPNRRPYGSADDALIDLRDLAAELGTHVCRRALVDFIEQMDPSAAQANASEGDLEPEEQPAPAPQALARPHPSVFIELPAEFELVDVEDPHDDRYDEDLDDEGDSEINLESLVEDGDSPHDGSATEVVAGPGLEDPLEWPGEAHANSGDSAPSRPFDDRYAADRLEPDDVRIASGAATAPTDDVWREPAEDAASSGTLSPSVRSRRAKRTRSARARKDKLRSAAAPVPLLTQKIEAPKPFEAMDEVTAMDLPAKPEDDARPIEQAPAAPVTPEEPEDNNWLVKPGRAEAFDPPTEDARHAPSLISEQPSIAVAAPFASVPPAAGGTMAPPVPVSFPPPALPQYPSLAVPPPPAPMTSAPIFATQPWTPAPIVAAPPPPPPAPATPSLAAPALKLKEPANKSRASRPSPPVTDIWATAPPLAEQRTSSPFPWKLAVAVLVAMAVLIVGGRAYLPAKSAARGSEVPAPASTDSMPSTPAREQRPGKPAAAPPNEAITAAANTGRLEIETQPAGAKILLDGKPAGESPLVLEAVAAGRHSVTLTTASGSVKRSIRIEPGRTIKLDVPIFSGWVGIFAPFVLEVSEAGRAIGTTEEPRLMLSPGRHELTLTNRELGYSSVQSVEIEPGETRSITLDPRGTVNLNASPWAEVWVAGKKVGDTPLAGLQLPLGMQEIAFRHPQFGERKVVVSVKGNAPAALSMDMTKR